MLSLTCLATPSDGIQPCVTPVEMYTMCRPTRTDIIRLSWDDDLIKPLAAVENGGWVLANDSLIGSIDKRWLTAISLKDRRPLWWFNTPYPVESPIAVFGGWAVIGTLDGSVSKIDLATGKKIWEKPVGHFPARAFTLSGSELFIYTINQQLYSLNYQTGDTNWIYDASATAKLTLRNPAPPLVANGKIYLGTSDGEVHTIDQSSGQLLWKVNPAYFDFRFHDVVGDMILLQNRLIVARYDGVVAALALDEDSHRTIWKNNFSSLTVAKLNEGILYLGSINGEVHAVEAFSGKEIWSVSTGQTVGSITVGEKSIFVAGTNGRIVALSRTSLGKILWTDDVESPLFNEPLVFDGKIYYISPLKLLYGYKLY